MRLEENLAGYQQLGLHFTGMRGPYAISACPFCGKPQHFGVHTEHLGWRCLRCGKHGSWGQFLHEMLLQLAKQTDDEALEPLAEHRGLSISTLRRWGVGKLPSSEMYTIPMWDGGKIVGGHRYVLEPKKTFGIKGSRNGLFMRLDGVRAESRLWICEGEWDAMALDEALTSLTIPESVIGVPGATSWSAGTLEKLAQGREICLAFDADEAGEKGDAQARKCLQGRTRKILSVAWPSDVKSGYDIRDLWLDKDKHAEAFWQTLCSFLKATPPVYTSQESDGLAKSSPAQSNKPALTREEVVAAFRKWLYFPRGDVEPLDVLFGTVLANRLDGEPVWLFIVGPPGSMKSTLLMALEDAPFITSVSTLTSRAMVSGAQRFGGEDPSLIPKWNGKVVIVKDFTPILCNQTGEREEIFNLLRDAYDGRVSKFFGNGVCREYVSKFGIIAGVTPKIEEFGASQSVIGERFLKYYLPIYDCWKYSEKAAEKALQNCNRESEMQRELKEASKHALDYEIPKDAWPEVPAKIEKKFLHLAMWLSLLRGAVSRDRYTREVLHKPVTEIGTRLAKQFKKLAQGIAAFRRKREVTEDEYRVIARIARGSAPDRVEEIVKDLCVNGKEGMTCEDLEKIVHLPADTIHKVLTDLELLRVVKSSLYQHRKRWRLTSLMRSKVAPLGLYWKEELWVKTIKGARKESQ